MHIDTCLDRPAHPPSWHEHSLPSGGGREEALVADIERRTEALMHTYGTHGLLWLDVDNNKSGTTSKCGSGGGGSSGSGGGGGGGDDSGSSSGSGGGGSGGGHCIGGSPPSKATTTTTRDASTAVLEAVAARDRSHVLAACRVLATHRGGGLRLKVQGLWFRIYDSALMVQDLWFRN
jgi:hypothetical protein